MGLFDNLVESLWAVFACKNEIGHKAFINLAEREGFEPSVPLVAAHTISSRAPSASSDISPLLINYLLFKRGGEDRIRTCGGREPPTVFETAAFNHSATSPDEQFQVGLTIPFNLYCQRSSGDSLEESTAYFKTCPP